MVSSSPRPLFLMVKPPQMVAHWIARNLRTTQAQDRLHMTLLPLGDRRDFSDDDFAELIERLHHLQLFAFRVAFDRVRESGQTVGLVGSEELEGAASFHAALLGSLARAGIRMTGDYRFHPHVTLAYRPDGLGNGAILPVSWLVEEFLLIESVYGEGRHIEHARVPLIAAPEVRMLPLAA